MIDTIKGDYASRDKAIFAKIWDACSIMDLPIQECFSQKGAKDDYKGDRAIIFGDNFDNLNIDSICNLAVSDDNKNSGLSIKNIINKDLIETEGIELNQPNENNKKRTYYSIIDFPNFLMHVLKIVYDENITLNEKELLNAFDSISSKFDAMNFISLLLRLRFLFDRYIVRVGYSEDSGDDVDRWYLVKPRKNRDNKLYFVNTFGQTEEDDQSDINNNDVIKPLSMLQATFRQRIYKDWLYNSLKWLISKDSINSTDYIQFLNEYITKYYAKITANCKIEEFEWNKIPHFIFNYIDYLYWIENKDQFNFDFKYRNSIEHHYPQSFDSLDGIENNIGNLCIVSKSANSKMNSESPIGKANRGGKYYKENLPPKQKTMYDITNNTNAWGQTEIINHSKKVNELLSKGIKIRNRK